MAMAFARSPSSSAPEQPARRLARLDQPLRLFRGGVIEQPVVAYETWGTLNAARDNTVLLFTRLSPSAHAASSPADPRPGWWESMIGEGKPIDTGRYFVVCVNSLGSPFGSSGPAPVDPRTGRPYGLGFPELSVEDIATGGHEALQSLGRLFGLLLRAGGLVPAIVVLVLVSAAASVKFRLEWRALGLMALLVAFCALVFVEGLGPNVPLLGAWFQR